MSRAAATPEKPAPARRRRRRWLVLVGIALALGILFTCWKPARVRGNSMWPTLRGDRDWILVERWPIRAARPERFDLWVFEEPAGEDGGSGGSRSSVKRVLALGGECIDFRAGDLFVGEDVDHLKRVARPAELVDAMLVPVFSLDEGGRDAMGRGFRLLSGSWSGRHLVDLEAKGSSAQFCASFDGGNREREEGVWDDHLGPQGGAEAGRHRVPDLRIDVEVLALGPATTFTLRHRTHEEEWRAIELSADEGLDIRGRHPRSTLDLLASLPDLAPPVTLRLQTIDGHFAVWRLDDAGRPFGPPLFENERDTLALAAWQPEINSWKTDSQVLLEVECGWARLGRLDIARDVYYFWPPGLRGAYHAGDGLFLVGDNPPASRDSRDYLGVPESRLIGRVCRMFWPRWREVR